MEPVCYQGSCNYDMIIGRDILQFLGINIQFSTQEVVWDYVLEILAS
jgi:hypothetical protein